MAVKKNVKRPGHRPNRKAADKKEQEKRVADFGKQPTQQFLDEAMNPVPGGSGLSLSMERILRGDPKILIVKSSKDSIVNPEKFKIEMAQLGFKVVFLEHKLNLGQQPVIERIGI